MQLTDLSGNSLGVCSSAIIGGGSTDENGNPVAVLGTNFLRAFYSVYEVNSATGTAQVCHDHPCRECIRPDVLPGVPACQHDCRRDDRTGMKLHQTNNLCCIAT